MTVILKTNMIKENREKIYSELKISLERERIFSDSNQKEKILDMILEKMDHIDIYYIYSNKASNSIMFLDNESIIIWDMNFWKCYENYLMQVENCKRLNKNITQGIICVVSEFLSDKYKSIPEISSFLKQIPDEFGIEIQFAEKYYDKIHSSIQMCKLFSFFHEIGHLEHNRKNSDRIKVCQELVLNLLDAVDEKDFLPLGEWSDLGWESVCLIREKKGNQILEELVCDVFAVMNMINYYKTFSCTNDFQLACECVISVEYISTFQNMFNAVNQAWDAHYIDMKFRLPVRKKEANHYVNELAMARNGLCSLILVIVINNMLNIAKCDREKIWEYRDNNHIDNEGVFSCLAADDFICGAIEDAFK